MRWYASWFAIISAVFPCYGYGLEIGPLVHEITTGSQGNRTKVTLTNNSSSQQFIDVNVNQLVFGEAGYGLESVSGKDLLVFPPAFKLAPGASQSVMVIWGGPPQLPESQSYNVKFSAINDTQLTVRDAIGIKINYNVIVHVSSFHQAADIVLIPILATKSGGVLRFAVKNRGSKYSKLSNFDLRLKNSRNHQEYLIPSRTIISEGLDTFLPANKTVIISIPHASLPALEIDQVILVEKAHE